MKKRDTLAATCDQLGVEVVIGSETHVTLNTLTKLNCSCKNTEHNLANTYICPVCTGQPGAMPQLNGHAVKKAILLGKSLNATLATTLDMERKHYEYPDLPSGFQRTQFWNPLIQGGVVRALDEDGKKISVDIDHVHLEEDAGKLLHDTHKKKSYVDYNRAGRPLLEVVTTPTIHSLPELLAYLKQLQRLVKVIGISEAELAKGYFKSDISISLRKKGDDGLHARTEIKNLSSFKTIEQAVAKEVYAQLQFRQRTGGPKDRQITVLYDEVTDSLQVMREKENSHDYRFIRESNIPSMDITQLIDTISVDLKYLPYTVEQALVDVGMRPQDATYFSSDLVRAQCLFSINEYVQDLHFVAKVLMNEINDEQFHFVQQHTATRSRYIYAYKTQHEFSHVLFKETCSQLIADGFFNWEEYVASRVSYDEKILDTIIAEVIKDNTVLCGEIEQGKVGKIGSLVGIVLAKSMQKVPGKIIKEKIETIMGLVTNQDEIDTSKKKQKEKKSQNKEVSAYQQSPYLANEYCTVDIGEINESMLGQEVIVAGWIQSVRDHGNLLFIDLRQNGEIVQIKVSQEQGIDLDIITRCKHETVIQVTGIVSLRDQDDYNPKLRTGSIEVSTLQYKIVNSAKELPFEIARASKVNETARLEFRYLSLRNEHIRKNMLKRSAVVHYIRNFFHEHGFYEIETPLLTKGSDEGSREFIVPSRLHAGDFYVLPQAPQQFKQLLMNADIHRYYQIAKCFRDEDARGDRQPEFTQVDIELAYVSEQKIMMLVSELLYTLVRSLYPKKKLLHPIAIPQLTYAEALQKYGTDKPDIRFGLELQEVTEIVRKTDFNIFRAPIEAGGIVKCLKVPGSDVALLQEGNPYFGQKYKKEYVVELVQSYGLGGLAYIEVHGDTLHPQMNVEKLGEDVCRQLVDEMGAQDGDTLFFAAHTAEIVNKALDAVRRDLGKKLRLYDDDQLGFVRIVDFPMFEKTETGEWKFTHNPFSMPKVEHMDAFMAGKEIEHIQAQQYDIVLNGCEIGGGSIRSHVPSILEQTYTIMGYSTQDITASIGHILEAFSYGCPPHGGLALGLDRLLMILQRQQSIRDVIVFPKTSDAKDLLMKAPASLSESTLRDVHIKSSTTAYT